MRALVLEGDPTSASLKLREVPDPPPRAGEIVVRIRFAALNRRDLWICKGLYPGINYPTILGSDGAGIIEALGDGVDRFQVGQEVVINPSLDWGPDERVQGSSFRILGMPDDGTFAELVRVPTANVELKPSSLSFEAAAALPLAGLTAYRAVMTKAKVQAGETVLVTGIGAGTATFALQFARMAGARVFVTSGSEAKLDQARQLGAVDGVNYRSENWHKTLRSLGCAPDVVIDSGGGESLATVLGLVQPAGRIVTFGATTGPVPSLDLFRVFWKQLALFGTTMGTANEFRAMLQCFEEERTELSPVIDRTFSIEQGDEALGRMENSEQFGKLLLQIG